MIVIVIHQNKIFFNQPLNIVDSNIQSVIYSWINDPSQNIFTNSTNIPYFGDIQNWDVSNVTNMSNLFKNQNGFNDNIYSWNTSNVTNMNSMFLWSN